jgi:polyhydroxybutyrate depolymerase
MQRRRTSRVIGAVLLFTVVLAYAPAAGTDVGAAPVAAATVATPAAHGPAPSAGCGTSQQGPVTEEMRTIDVDGTERWFLLTVPTAHDGTKPLSLVIDFHGLLEGAIVHTQMSAFSPVAEREGFVVVFPQGQFDPVRWNASPTTVYLGDPNNDLDFVDQIIEQLDNDLCLDRTRVYAAGLSYGAMMNSLLACARSQSFAAIAPVAGIRLLDPCPEERPVPIITFHGTADPIVFFNGGFGAIPGISSADASPTAAPPDVDLNGPGIPANVAGMAAINGCAPTPTDTQLTAEVIHRVYDCPPGADVEFYIVIGGGHTWPGSEFSRLIESVVGYTTFDIDASQLAWDFFQQFQLPCASDATCDDQPTTTTSAPATQAVAPSFTG